MNRFTWLLFSDLEVSCVSRESSIYDHICPRENAELPKSRRAV